MGGDALRSPSLRDRQLSRTGLGVALVATLFLAACGVPAQYKNYAIPAAFSPDPPKSARAADPVRLVLRDSIQFDGGIRVVVPDRAVRFPDFEWTDSKGRIHSNETLHGRAVWIDLWAEWCATCRAEFPGVQRAYERLKDRNATILAVCRNSSREGFASAARKKWITFPMIDASQVRRFAVPYGAFPTSVVLDRLGRVRAFWQGHRDLEAVESVLEFLAMEDLSDETPTIERRHDELFPPIAASESVLSARLDLGDDVVAPGDSIEAKLVFHVNPGWHLTADDLEGSIPLEIEVTSGEVEMQSLFPEKDRILMAGVSREVYKGLVEFPLRGLLEPGLPSGTPVAFQVRASFQACDSTSCLAPSSIELSGEVVVGEARP